MKDGCYAMRFSADGYRGKGRFDLQDNRGEGRDDQFSIQGHLVEQGNNLTAIFNVLISPAVTGNSRLPDHYSLTMSGTSNGNSFMLIGVGPLGVIVDIDCTWIAAPETN